MFSNILHRISKKGKIYLHFTIGAITCYDNGANLFSHFKPFGNVKCQSSNVKSNPKFKCQKAKSTQIEIFEIGTLAFI